MKLFRKAFYLVLGEEGVTLISPHDGVAPVCLSGHDTKAATTLAAYLEEDPHHPVILLVDLQDQTLCTEESPPLSFYDRRAFAKRNCATRFAAPSIGAFKLLPDRKILYAGLYEPDKVSFWLGFLETRTNPSGAVRFLPCETASLAATLVPNAAKGWVLLASWHGANGWRLTINKDNAPFFTRLIPPAAHTQEAARAAALMREINATATYLARFGLEKETSLRVILLAPETLQNHFEALTPPWPFHIFGLHQAAALLKLKNIPHTQTEEATYLLVRACQNKRPFLTYRTDRAQKTARNKKILTALKTGSFLCLLFFAALLTQKDQAYKAVQAQRAAYEQEAAALQNKQTSLMDQLAKGPRDLTRLRKALARARLWQKSPPDPFLFMTKLQPYLDDETRALQYEWQRKKEGAQSKITLRLSPSLASQDKARQLWIDKLRQKLAPAVTLLSASFPKTKEGETPSILNLTLGGGSDETP